MIFLLFAFKKKINLNYSVFLKQQNVCVRTGPNFKSDIKFILTERFHPFRVISEYDNWIQITDYSGEIGWAHRSYFSNKFIFAIVLQEIPVFKKPNTDANKIANIGNNNIIKILKKNNHWLYISFRKGKKIFNGWIKNQFLWF